ncbi:hemerythrin domain-containing protein [Azoarcus sp. TTM-91]|uniref:hemerythrin domain-containing protein n=1 Tax=Azoarcus sp. TTM-91 TaxID=2691581 RepID=UPI00145D531F|nr:hemerythrin domain-containing protein [Azoarcus sp. TTM-91]NMG37291.1 hemerythrin domain-containing protein [Azoarcus sp. TTM-91]
MDRLTHFMQHHHGHCDEAFATAEADAHRGDWSACAASLARFRADLLGHLAVEEERIFPAFEASTGNTAGPTRVMRAEHEEMRELLGWLDEALAGRNAIAFADAAETLLILLQQHNMKEENILYPMCDRILGGDEVAFNQLMGEVEQALMEVAHG